ncbi:hypothetical protein [Longimicrobium sp.]|uniref:hypothetical protein n=1 Tax=Longimicrobium sp. TaxID=2029185 RepID=UPI002F953536
MTSDGGGEHLSWLAEQSLLLGSQCYARLLSRAWADPDFHRLLVRHPEQAMEQEFGGSVGERVTVRVLEEPPGRLVLVLPPNPYARGGR